MSEPETSAPSAVPATAAPLRLLVADDQPLIRRGLALMLAAEPGVSVVAQAADGQEAIEMALLHRPDVAVMDLQMPRASGVVATREIAAQLPDTRVVVLTTYDDDELVFEAIRAGAQAYLLKDASEAEVLETIRAVARGESRLSPAVARKVMEQFRRLSAPSSGGAGGAGGAGGGGVEGAAAAAASAAGPLQPWEEPLTEREEQILERIAQGLTNKQIAQAIFLAEGTVKNYVSRIMQKLHASSRVELAMRVAQRRS
jgi:DNA-binding NarL/FixJ family response regulator